MRLKQLPRNWSRLEPVEAYALTATAPEPPLLKRLRVDADKINYGRYYNALFSKVPSRGLILADNLLWGGAVLDKKAQDSDTRALRAFAKEVRADRRVESILLTVRDGLLLIRKR